MFFQSKIDRAMKWLKDKNKTPDDGEENIEDIELEKTDILAIIISALLVFTPIFIVLFIILILVFKI